MGRRLADLRGVAGGSLSPAEQVDAAILVNALELRRFELEELREHEWDPLSANPGTAVYTLLARDFAPLGDRLRSVAGRLAAVPGALETARASLDGMPRVHVETAIGQFTGTRTLLATELERALGEEPGLRAEVEPARESALAAIDSHLDWLRAALDTADRDPRLGAAAYARKLALTLDTASDADAVLARAEAELEAIEEQIAETAARLDDDPQVEGRVRRVLDALAARRVGRRRHDRRALRARARADDGVRPGQRPGDRARRPGRDHRDAGDPPRRGGRLLQPAGAAREHPAPDLLRGVTDTVRLVARPGRVVLPRVQRAHAAEPDGPRGDARPRAAARAQRALLGAGAGAQGAVERLVRRGLGGLRRGGDGRRGLPGRRGALRRAADAAAQDAAADDHQRHPRRPRPRPRHDRGRGDAADDRSAGTRRTARRPASGAGRS